MSVGLDGLWYTRSLLQRTQAADTRKKPSRRRLGTLEDQSERMHRTLSEQHSVEGLREGAGKERFDNLERTLRDIQRGVQLIRDKQVGLVPRKSSSLLSL